MNTRRVLLLFVLAARLSACAAQPIAIPTLMVLPSVTPLLPDTAVPPTAIPPTVTPLPITRLPVLPTATIVTSTPRPTATLQPTLVGISAVSHFPPAIMVPVHPYCEPLTAVVRVILDGPAPPDQLVLLKWDFAGRITSRPGQEMQPLGLNEFSATLGPFDEAGTIIYRVIMLGTGGRQVFSDEYTLEVGPCVSTPLPADRYGRYPTLTPTPQYGAALSVQAINQTIIVESGLPVNVILSWEGGASPYTISRVTRPAHGALSGSGAARVYLPDVGYTGPDQFTFVITDGYGQASTGTITLVVGE